MADVPFGCTCCFVYAFDSGLVGSQCEDVGAYTTLNPKPTTSSKHFGGVFPSNEPKTLKPNPEGQDGKDLALHPSPKP